MPVVKGKFRKMDCTPNGEGYKCVCQCGFTYDAKSPNAAHGCPDLIERESAPSLLQKVGNFAKSAVRHVASGMPMCTQEQVDERFRICQGCEFLKDGACLKCGCPLVREKKFLSKLSWANESCPVGKWGPVGHSSVGPDASAG